MSKLTRHIAYFVFLFAFLFRESVSAQESASSLKNSTPLTGAIDSISAEKKKALDDLADLQISNERRIELTNMVSSGLTKAIRAGMDQRINTYTLLSNDQRSELGNYRESLAPKISEDVSTITLMVVTKVNEFTHEQAYQIYGNGLTQEEIVRTVKFYKSQAGQKYLMGKAQYPTFAQLKSGTNGPDNYWTQSELSALIEFEKTTASEKIRYLDSHSQVYANKFMGEKLRPALVELIGKYQKLIDDHITTFLKGTAVPR